jgi:hypothetical protein
LSALEDQVAAEQERHEAGQTVDDIDPEAVAEPTPPLQIPIEGMGTTITTTPGGDKPQTASISLRGGKLNISGEFKKGDVVEFYVRARVSEVNFVDTVDKYGEVTGTERKHVVKPIAVRRLAASEG